MASTNLSILMPEMAISLGAFIAGISTRETLAGGPLSTDLTHVLPTARSAITFALPLDPEKIERYLKKEDHEGHNLDKIRTTTLANGIALEMANFLDQLGYKSVPLAANFQYRNDATDKIADRKPPVSHRYLAVASGIGFFGWSGHILTKKYGPAIVLASVVTEAELEPTGPLPESENYCNRCRICRKVCPSGFISPDQTATISLGGREYSYAKRGVYARCEYACAGMAGLDRSQKWSNWSASRYPIPENDADLRQAIMSSFPAYLKRPVKDHVFYMHFKTGYDVEYSCSHCQLVCHPDFEVRKKRSNMITASGVIVQDEEGVCRAVSPEEAERILASMPHERRALYELLPPQ